MKTLKKIFAVIFIGLIFTLLGIELGKSIAYNIAKFLVATVITFLMVLSVKWLIDE